MRLPRASSYRKRPPEPTRLHPPFLAIASVLSPGRAAFNPPSKEGLAKYSLCRIPPTPPRIAGDGRQHDRRARGGRNRAGTARRVTPRLRTRRDRLRARVASLRSLARVATDDQQRRRARGGGR